MNAGDNVTKLPTAARRIETPETYEEVLGIPPVPPAPYQCEPYASDRLADYRNKYALKTLTAELARRIEEGLSDPATRDTVDRIVDLFLVVRTNEEIPAQDIYAVLELAGEKSRKAYNARVAKESI